MKVVTAGEMREIDRRAQEEFGISEDALMCAAGAAVAESARKIFAPARVCVVCGKGNNGGDGYVVARELLASAVPVEVIAISPPDQLRGPAQRAYEAVRGLKIPLHSGENLSDCLAGCDLIVDAMLGTGTRGALSAEYAAAAKQINLANVPVLAVDVPSGVYEMNAGEESGEVVHASRTVTIGLPKVALLNMPGILNCGVIEIAPINFPPELLQVDRISLNWAVPTELRDWIPLRRADANKGMFGKVGIIGGSLNYAGAAILAARAALRSGSGLVCIFAPQSLNAIYKSALPEAITHVVDSQHGEEFDASSIDPILRESHKMDALIVGPGLGRSPGKTALIHRLLGEFAEPILLDADALNAIADDAALGELIGRRGSATVITPHPGEAARLLSRTVSDIQQDRPAAAIELTRRFRCLVLLKGAGTLIARPDGQTWIVPGACSAMAKGGSGDVLSGVIGSLLGQGVEAYRAAVLGAHVHLHAGMKCARQVGERGVLASELADAIPLVFEKFDACG